MLRRLLSHRSDFVTALVSCLVWGAFLAIAPIAHAQESAPPGTGGMLSVFSSLPQWQQAIVGILGAVSALGTALSFLLGLLGSFWAPALKAAAWCSKAGIELHQLGAWLGSLMGGAHATPNAAMAAPAKANTRGFTGVQSMMAVALCGVVACGLFAAAVPSATVLGACVVEYIKMHPGADFESYVVNAAWARRSDIALVVESILASADPSLAAYKEEARATKADVGKMNALRARLAVHAKDAGQ